MVSGTYPGTSESFRLILREVRSGGQTLAPTLSARDAAVLHALDQYRYLDTGLLRWLFFPSERKSREHLQRLTQGGLVRGWRATLQPGRINRPTIFVLTGSGARALARHLRQDPKPFVKRSANANARTRQLSHDLEANGFFVSLAVSSRDRADEGLYHWLGAAACRLVSKRERIPPSDGWGRYLLADGEVRFYLEWDRGTEHVERLGSLATAYASYFAGRRDADRRHVVFVVPTEARERETQRELARALVRLSRSCRLWTATAESVRSLGSLGRVWLESGASQPRRALREMPAAARSDLSVADCIGKPRWWERRLAGGEGA